MLPKCLLCVVPVDTTGVSIYLDLQDPQESPNETVSALGDRFLGTRAHATSGHKRLKHIRQKEPDSFTVRHAWWTSRLKLTQCKQLPEASAEAEI